jgi:hypothetical protein
MFFSTSVDCFLSACAQPLAGGGQQRQQVLGGVLGVFVDVEEQRALFIGAAPDAVALQELGVGQALVAAPELVVLAAPRQELAQPRQHRLRPDQVAAGQRHQAVDVAPHVEAALLGGSVSTKCEHEVRGHMPAVSRAVVVRFVIHLPPASP